MGESQKVALVTGGTRGIGLAVAEALGALGFDLAVAGRREESEVAPALASLRAGGRSVRYLRADIGETDDRARLVAEVKHHFGHVNVLVNNAGVAPEVRTDLIDATEESFDRLIRINLKGPYFLTQAVARLMLAQREADPSFTGCIVNVSSISATVASTDRGDYCLSKAGLAMATMLWAVRLGAHGIPVYEVRPGVIRTDMTERVTDKYDRMIANGLLVQPRWGLPEDVGRAVAALVRGDLSYSSGAVVMVDGGLTVSRL
jgi:NAD(P)-dependent dehydrogenase (short-subunit alcohol dehydrogenase family)